MPQTLSQSQVIEAMVEFVRAHLELQDRKEKSETQSLVFSGVREERTPKRRVVARKYTLDVITKIGSAAYPNVFQRRLRARIDEGKDRVYTGILIPRSLNYHNADPIFEGPYLRTAHLLPSLDQRLFEKYKEDFWRTPICILSDFETDIVIPLTNNNVAYYNPKDVIQIFNLRAFPEWQIIPFNKYTPNCKLTIYDELFLRNMESMPDPMSRSTEIFVNKEIHLHRVVRTMIKRDEIDGNFTLSHYKNPKCEFYGARLRKNQ